MNSASRLRAMAVRLARAPRQLAALTLTTAALACVAAPVEVKVAQGTLLGTLDTQGAKFLGVPYAAPPVGERRWRPPAPAASWPGTRDATKLGAACPQAPSPFGPASTNEDCLYANIFVPPGTAPNARLPVFVWFHGGAFVLGSGNDFDGSELAASGGMIVVTLNYRLGIFGFLAHPELSSESTPRGSGNYGLQDQQAALAWVRDNITAFGGDPARVTIAGQSAGGLSVLSHLASPAAKGLFHRAIVQSGTYRLRWPTLQSREAQGKQWAAALGCDSNVTTCLRAQPVERLLTLGDTGDTTQNALAWGPVAGTAPLPVQPMLTYLTGGFNRVPVLMGNARDEGQLFTALSFDEQGKPLTAEAYPAAVKALVGNIAGPLALQRYPLAKYADAHTAYATLYGDSGLACVGMILQNTLSSHVPTQVYELNDPSAGTVYVAARSHAFGSTHTSDVPFLFPGVRGHADVQSPKVFTVDEQVLAKIMRGLWSSFAKQGRAGGGLLPTWPLYTSSSGAYLSLEPPTPVVRTRLGDAHQCSFWNPLLTLAGLLPASLTGAPY